jgi:bacteriophage HK97-gp10 putative tail-component
MSVIYIDTNSLKGGSDNFKNMSAQLAGVVDDVLNANALEIDAKAKELAPGDRGFLRQNISADTSQFLRKQITVNAIYAAYVEFGTGAYAAQYVSTLPEDWQVFASQFKHEQGSRSIKGLLFVLTGWFSRHGINKQQAYFIARKIFIYGTKPHSFLYKAYQAQLNQLETDLNNALKAFGK